MERAADSTSDRAAPFFSLWAFVVGLVCTVVLLTVNVLQTSLYGVIIEPGHPSIHVASDFVSIVVAFSIFAVGWYGYKQNRNTQDLWVALGFMIIGAVDFAHAMSYAGGLGLPAVAGKVHACPYWVTARLFAALTLLIASFVRPDSRKPWVKPKVLLPAALATIVVVVGGAGRLYALPAGAGWWQAQAKPLAEYLTIAMLALSVVTFGKFGHRERSSVELLQIGLVVSIFSELSLILHSSSSDAFNLPGHLFNTVAYYLFLRALFVSSLRRPYLELVAAKEQLAGLVRETGDLYRQAERQRRRLERSFAQIGSALGSSLDVTRTLDLIVELAADMIGAEAAIAAVPNIERHVLEVRASRGLAPGESEIPLGRSLAAEAIAERKAKWTGDSRRRANLWRPRLASGEVRSALTIPMVYEDKILGVLTLYSSRPHAFGRHSAKLLGAFAGQAAVAVDNASRYGRERRIAQSFQRRLLPVLPRVPGIDLAARYEPASSTAEVGGDLYDAILLDPSRLALVIGDVSGKGLDAATIMASTQHMMRGFLFQGMQPGEVLSGLHSALSKELEPHRFVTIFLSILDLSTHEISYANAGHPFPVLAAGDGCWPMTGHNGGPVGAFGSGGTLKPEGSSFERWAVNTAWGYKTDHMILAQEFGMLMYTDGLLDARSGNSLFGEGRIIDVCEASRDATGDELVDKLLAEAKTFSAGDLADDIALLAVNASRPPEAAPELSWDI